MTISEVYEAIQATVACIQTTSKLWVLKIEDTNGGLYFDMAPKLDFAKYEVNLIELDGKGPVPNTKFFNLFIGFLAKPANWWAYLVQKPEKKPRSILVLKSTLQQCGKNIITDFIGDKVLGEHLHYATSDLEKILGRFNSPIQARKLIVMNESGMSSAEWHKFNGHLKSFITEEMVSIERKGIETKRIRDFTGFMGNTAYFKRLGNVLNHPDASGVVMRYLLSRDLSDFKPQEISATKMKVDIMRDQLPSPIRFIIDYITSRVENGTSMQSHTSLYQKYLEWCGENGEKILTSKVAGKKFSEIGIESKQVRTGSGKREWQYILDYSKIIAKLCESSLETISQKIILPQPECHNRVADRKNKPSPNTSKDKKASNQDDSTQALFDYVTEDTCALVASTSGTSETSKRPEPVIGEPETIELPESNKPISKNTNTPPKEIPADSSNPNKLSSAILLARAQRDERLRKKVVELGEDSDVFVTITKKDRLDSIAFQDRMETDSQMCGYTEEVEEDPKEYMNMTVWERLIGEEIIRRSLEEDGITSSWLDTDKE
ncbi:hypothetical protein RhiirC2_795548 [Rhizophagus irregularis]|uniref:NrS-1 polymerase-like helicase domain-containing protein n=1 Tax=Rhizophagus irregularis TaxID=588596 RepID=A0A2N1MBC1_9GLOM|nr:hypothetical protein RhiirC2_795548 [Rhizophagus irregularis]